MKTYDLKQNHPVSSYQRACTDARRQASAQESQWVADRRRAEATALMSGIIEQARARLR